MLANTRIRFTDLVDEAGISYRQADYWCRSGYVHTRYLDRSTGGPTDSGGSGQPRYIDDDEADVLRVMARLVHAGFTAEAAARLARDRTRLTDAVLRAVERLQKRAAA